MFFFLMHADITAVTTQSNKIVSNEVKRQLSTTSTMVWKKLNELFGYKRHTEDKEKAYVLEAFTGLSSNPATPFPV